jgi:multimeric flavodoxin WrbA
MSKTISVNLPYVLFNLEETVIVRCFLDRLFYVSVANGNLFRHKVAAAVVAVRRTGGSYTLNGLNHYLTYAEMIVTTSSYWNVIHGRTPNEVSQDGEGVHTLHLLGKNMAWLLKMKEAASGTIQPPMPEKKIVTNFIR